MKFNIRPVFTHIFFIVVVEAENTGKGKPKTYTDYPDLKSGGCVATAGDRPTKRHWVCSVCHYVYDGDIPFEALPDNWICPVCKQSKYVFLLQ